MKTPRIAGTLPFVLLLIMSEALFAQGPKPLPTKCSDKPQSRVQPVWIADTSNLKEPKACIEMYGRLVFQEPLKKPTFILLTEQYLALTFPKTVGPIVMSVGPSTYYQLKNDGTNVIFDIDAANSLLNYFSMAARNEKQAGQIFFYFKSVTRPSR
jgi:hypothetical protein